MLSDLVSIPRNMWFGFGVGPFILHLAETHWVWGRSFHWFGVGPAFGRNPSESSETLIETCAPIPSWNSLSGLTLCGCLLKGSRWTADPRPPASRMLQNI